MFKASTGSVNACGVFAHVCVHVRMCVSIAICEGGLKKHVVIQKDMNFTENLWLSLLLSQYVSPAELGYLPWDSKEGSCTGPVSSLCALIMPPGTERASNHPSHMHWTVMYTYF